MPNKNNKVIKEQVLRKEVNKKIKELCKNDLETIQNNKKSGVLNNIKKLLVYLGEEVQYINFVSNTIQKTRRFEIISLDESVYNNVLEDYNVQKGYKNKINSFNKLCLEVGFKPKKSMNPKLKTEEEIIEEINDNITFLCEIDIDNLNDKDKISFIRDFNNIMSFLLENVKYKNNNQKNNEC